MKDVDAIKNTKLATSASFRISNKSPKEFIEKIIQLNRETSSPAFFNDEIAVKMMVNDGYTLEDARDYCIIGCVEPSDNGKTFGATGGTKVYFPTALDLVFNRGKTTFFGNQDTVDTGNPLLFKTFDEFLNAFFVQLNQMVDHVAIATNLRDQVWATHYHNPLISCTIDGCIENAKDMTEGGAIYNFGAIGGGGLGTAVDSLAAIKKFVYDEQSVTMAEMIAALETNFKGLETLRQRLLNGPKFGNDDDYVDSIATQVVSRFCDMVSSHRFGLGGHFKASLISYGLNIYEGKLEPATPDGRLAGEPLSNSISPSNGAERKGPTAMLKSEAKIDHTKIGFGDSLNMRFPQHLLMHENGIRGLQALIETYFKMGGFHVQVNMAGTDVLRDAQTHPDQYPDLIVRVSGYSAYFSQLGRDIQDDIIARVEFSC
nr:pyruvate formate lyase family protein [Candidatus Sigynarchaeum springense]